MPRADPEPLELVLADRLGARALGVEHLDRRRRRSRVGRDSPSARPPSTTVDECSSSSISHFAANRERSSSRATRSPSPGSVSSRKSSAPRRQTTSGAITRAFGVSSSASHDSPDAERLDVVRDHPLAGTTRRPARARRRSPAAGAATRNVVTVIETSVASVFRSKAERKVVEAGYDPARLPPGQYLTEKWPVLHAGVDPAYRPTSRPGTSASTARSRTRSRSSWDELERAPADDASRRTSTASRAGAASTSTFEGVHWSAIERARRAAPVARTSSSRTPRRATRRTCPIVVPRRDPRALLATHADGEPLTPEHGWPLRLVDPRQVLLEEREVAPRDRAHRRPTRPASGSATATTTTPTPGRSSATRSTRTWTLQERDALRRIPRTREQGSRSGAPNHTAPTLPSITETAVPPGGRLTFLFASGNPQERIPAARIPRLRRGQIPEGVRFAAATPALRVPSGNRGAMPAANGVPAARCPEGVGRRLGRRPRRA